MSEISTLKEAFKSGTAPSGANAKKFEKLLKKYEHIVNPMFVHLYPVRDCRYNDTTYRVFAIPVNNDSIDGETKELKLMRFGVDVDGGMNFHKFRNFTNTLKAACNENNLGIRNLIR